LQRLGERYLDAGMIGIWAHRRAVMQPLGAGVWPPAH
jgi:hypothetical protein